jgi:TolB-like protein
MNVRTNHQLVGGNVYRGQLLDMEGNIVWQETYDRTNDIDMQKLYKSITQFLKSNNAKLVYPHKEG